MNVYQGSNKKKEDVSPRTADATYADIELLPDWFMEVCISCHGTLLRPTSTITNAECFCATPIYRLVTDWSERVRARFR